MPENAAISRPKVSAIALCYNHARFVEACLDSIAAQTCRDYELIVTDDCSSDDSPRLIENWLAEHAPDARFIRHTENRGICRTLNEAVSAARGKYISLMATDDLWKPDKIARQVALLDSLPDTCAVVYSDADIIDEAGVPLPGLFIASKRPPGGPRPQGDVFVPLAEANFIPAMSTLIRRDALLAAGGYDERLVYEDWDMWLRLAMNWQFAYLDAPLATYRLVTNSMARTLFEQKSVRNLNLNHTTALIAEKCLASGKLDSALKARWQTRLEIEAFDLFVADDPRAAAHLRAAFRWHPGFRRGMFALLATLGITETRYMRLRGLVDL